MGGGRRTTHLLRHYRPHRKLSAPASSSHSPGSAGLGREAMHSLLRAPKFPFFGSVHTKNTPQPPRLCSPNPRFVLFNPLRLFPDVITLRRYSPHTNVVSYPSGIMTHFFFSGAGERCLFSGRNGSCGLRPTSDAAQHRNPNASADRMRCLF